MAQRCPCLLCMRSASNAGDGKNGVRWVRAKGCVLCLHSLWWCQWGLQSALCSPAAFSLAATPQGAGPVGGLLKQGEPERGLTQGLCHNISAFCTSKERFTAAAPWHSEIKGFLFPSITLWSLCLRAAYLSLIMFIMAMHTVYESKSFSRLSSALKFNNKV